MGKLLDRADLPRFERRDGAKEHFRRLVGSFRNERQVRVRGVDGRDLGRVTDVLSAPENDIYVISGPSGEVLIPAVDDVVQDVDLSAGLITIEIVPGLLP